jgi:uncharacterized protein
MSDSFLVRLPKGEDLLEAMTAEFTKRSMPKASFTLVGAVDKAVLGFYDTETREYVNREFEGPLEIVSCIGNVSERDGEIFVHAHACLGDAEYACFGGHLMPGTIIFAAELCGTPVPGPTPVRKFDEPTGLVLWADD